MKEIFQSKGKGKMNVWKIIAAVFIILFCVALIGGLFLRMSQPRPSFMAPTQEQIDSVKAIVAQELAKEGDDINNYEVFVENRIGKFDGLKIGGFPRHERLAPRGNVIHVSLHGNSTSHFYLVDIDSEKVVMHSFTEWVE